MTRSFTEINQAIAWQLKESIGQDRFDLWFVDENAISICGSRVMISANDDLSLVFIRQQFESDIRESISAVLGTETEIKFVVNQTANVASKQHTLFSDQQLVESGISPRTNVENQKTGKRNLRRRPSAPQRKSGAPELPAQRVGDTQTLGSFLFGKQNLLLETAINEIFAEPGKFNPLVVYGPVGCGKSHLATAIVAKARQTRRFRRCVNITAEQFTSSFIDALQNRRLTDFRSKFRNVDLLAMDDIHFLAGKQATIVEFQNTLESLLRSGKQVIVTADRPVGELRFADDSLFNRLSSGLACPIRYPDRNGRIEIVKRLAAIRDLELDSCVEKVIADRITRDVRLLSGAVNRMKAASLVSDEPLDLEFAENFLGDLFHSQSPIVSLSRIEKAVCDVCGVEVSELKSSKRIARISTARMLAMWLSRKHTSAGLAEIGDFYGGRSHSTVIAAQKKINGLLESDATIDLRTRRTTMSLAVGRLENALEVG